MFSAVKPTKAKNFKQKMSTTNKLEKQKIRESIGPKLKQITLAAAKIESQEVFNQIINSEIYKQSTHLGLFLTMREAKSESAPKEVDTIPLLKHALDSGKKCYVPVIHHEPDMHYVRINNWTDFEAFPTSPYGFPEPPKETVLEREDCT